MTKGSKGSKQRGGGGGRRKVELSPEEQVRARRPHVRALSSTHGGRG
jgi:hypothetical protein